MSASHIEIEILEKLHQLDDSRQLQVLNFVREMIARSNTAGTPASALLRFVGCIEPADLETIATTIQQGCEQVELNEWLIPAGY